MTRAEEPVRRASPFHAGEQVLQARTGMRARIEQVGRKIVRDFMPDQHRELFEELPYLILGSLDRDGQPWASIVSGAPGFVVSPDSRTLFVAASPVAGDPLADNLRVGAPLGVLGIELETRRRNRANGSVTEHDGAHFTVHVEQSFGNCSQYIQARTPSDPVVIASSVALPKSEGALLSEVAVRQVRQADTLFIASASAHAERGSAPEGVDVSHRGGKPGFVRVTIEGASTVLTMPDFRGNFLFNTLGNIEQNPVAGCLFIDFDNGSLLLVSGDATVIWSGEELAHFEGAERLLRVRVRQGVRIEQGLPLRWSAPEFASQLERTGAWPEQSG